MTPLDYGRSFLIGNEPENEVRFWVESRTRIIDAASGQSEDYVQVGRARASTPLPKIISCTRTTTTFCPSLARSGQSSIGVTPTYATPIEKSAAQRSVGTGNSTI